MPILVSDAHAEESLQAYTSPLSLQAKALNDISEKVLNGAVVSDGNNPFTFLTEFSSNMTADIVTKACECFNNLYPENAQTATELYKHLSDFGYIGLYATPASTTVELVLNRKFIIDNAVDTNESTSDLNYNSKSVSGTYSKIVIPSYSKFTIGDYIFGLMYPIEIRVRKSIKDNQLDYQNTVITVVWDTTYQNPLMPLETHILEHRDFEQDGVSLTAIEIPIYQFEVENHVENAVASTGFAKRYDYRDKFYAVRVFHFKQGRWIELEQTFSDTNYDPDIPTAVIKVLQDIGKVEVVIPHIYFNTNDIAARLGNRILVKLYTTKGEINVDLTEFQLEQFQASFLLTDTNLVVDDKYSNMLKRIPTVYILPLVTRINSGTNGITFQQLKDRVKYNNSYTVKITPSDLENYFHTSGYKFTKELDNITDRVYCAHKVLSDKTGTPIASGVGKTIISSSMVEDEQYKNSIIKVNDETFTINPAALFKYNADEDEFVLLTDQEKDLLLSSDLETKVNAFNSDLYTYSPFHIVVSNSKSTPISGVFDMYNPTLRSIMFDWENNTTTAEVSVYTTSIKPRVENDTLLGYTLRVSIFKTANIENIPSVQETTEYIRVLLTTETSDGLLAHMYGTYEGVDTDGKDVFVFNIDSKFRIDNDGNIDLTSFKHELGIAEEVFVPSGSHTYTISFFMNAEKINQEIGETPSQSNSAIFAVPSDLDGYVMLCRQIFTLKLGEALPLLHGNITISTTDAVFKTYPTMQFATYQTPIYERWSLADYKDPNEYLNDSIRVFKNKYIADHEGEVDPVEYAAAEQAEAERIIQEEIPLLEEKNKEVDAKLGTLKYINGHLITNHAVGDVILSSQYGAPNGPTLSLSVGDELVSMELQPLKKEENYNPEEDEDYDIDEENIYSSGTISYYNPTSSKDDVWESTKGQLYVECSSRPEFTGIYKLVADSEGDIYRCEKEETLEKFDETYLQVMNSTDANSIGRYVSSNSRTIKRKLENVTPPIEVDTEAKGTERKYFSERSSMGGGYTGVDFDFETYTGYVIEYANNDLVESYGLGQASWVLVKYEQVTEGGVTYPKPTLIGVIAPVTSKTSYNGYEDSNHVVSNYSAEQLLNDTYAKGIAVVQYSMMKVDSVNTSNSKKWVLAKGTDPNACIFEAAIRSGNSRVSSITEPWEVTWQAASGISDDPPSVSRINTNHADYKLISTDALRFMVDEASLIGQQGIGRLYRTIKDGEDTDNTTAYVASDIESETLYVLTRDKTKIPNKDYYTREMNPVTEEIVYNKINSVLTNEELVQYFGDGETPPTVYEIVDPVFIVVSGDDGMPQYLVNSTIEEFKNVIPSQNPYEEDQILPNTGGVYYRDYDAYNYNYEDDGLTINHIKFIFDAWKESRNSSLSEDSRYENLLNDFSYQYGNGILSINVLKKIVSDSEPSYWFPYKKVVACGTTSNIISELQTYLNSEESQDKTYGLVSILYKTITDGDRTVDIPIYINFISEREYTIDDKVEVGLSVNPDYSQWGDPEGVDKWPWEYTTPWVCLTPNLDDDEVAKIRDDLTIKYNTQLSGTKVLHDTSDLELDEDGNPVIAEDGDRELVYGIDAIQCDYKLSLSEDAEYIDYFDSIRNLILSYLYELKAITPSLLARTKLYFSPIRTFGNSEFKGSHSEARMLPVQCSIELGLHIESYVHNSITRKRIIREEIIEYILKDIKDGTINLATLAQTLMKELSDDIVFVDVLGINGDKTLQTLIPVYEDCYPQLKQILVLHDDGTIHADRDLVLDWYVIN